MKWMSLLLLSVFLLSCKDMEDTPPVEGWNPTLCREKSSAGCGVDWFISLKTKGLPENVEIVLNDVAVINECDPHSSWTVSPTAQITEFKINDYVNLGGTEKINLAINDLKDCHLEKTLKSYDQGIDYEVKSTNGLKEIHINKN